MADLPRDAGKKAKNPDYCDILITGEGNVYIEPLGEAAELLIAGFEAGEKDATLRRLCG